MLCEQSNAGKMFNWVVLILVLMEYALREHSKSNIIFVVKCLNPCFNGICSARQEICLFNLCLIVLILVLMEYALRGMQTNVINKH